MKPYSIDLRQKIVDSYAKGNTSMRKLATQFNVALSFIEKLIKQHRETGDVAPKKRTQQTPTKLNSEQLEILECLVEENNDATLRELCNLLEQRTQVSISVSTMDRMLTKLGFTLKKNTAPKQKRNRKGSKTAV